MSDEYGNYDFTDYDCEEKAEEEERAVQGSVASSSAQRSSCRSSSSSSSSGINFSLKFSSTLSSGQSKRRDPPNENARRFVKDKIAKNELQKCHVYYQML